jgi:DNA repair protein SbcC/Rad50
VIGKKMISKISISNFRTHRNTVLNLSNGVNVIVGLPDSGKTNIIRGLLWALTNRPSGFRFHNDTSSEADTSVRIDFTDNQWIQIIKNKKQGQYLTSVNKETLKAIGQDVPNSVSDIANMSELNIQRQLDKHFLICSSPAEVAKTFNRITRLEKIDKSVALLTTDINSQNKNIKSLNEETQRLQEKIDDIGDLKEMEIECKDITDDENDLKENDKKIEKVSIIIIAIESVSESLNKYKKLPNALKAFEIVEQLLIGQKDYDNDIERLSDVLDDLTCRLEKLKATEDIEKALISFELLLKQWSDFETYKKEMSDIEDAIYICEKLKSSTEGFKKELDKDIKEYKAFLSTISICPFCEKCSTPLSEHDFNLFLKEFE